MINFTEAKAIFDTVIKVIKISATHDLQEKIMDLREFIFSLRSENIVLKEENQALKLQISAKQDFELRNGLYWRNDDQVPFCQKCLDGSQKSIHLQHSVDGWKCFECKSYYDPTGRNSTVYLHRPNIKRVNPAL